MRLTKHQVIDFAILALRWYLAYYMADYGWSKITGGQFSVHDPAILEKPLKNIDKFYISWYLFSLSKSFNIIVGISQIAGAILIVFNRTVLIGALMLLPVLIQIFLIDMTFTTSIFSLALPLRLGGMIASDILILLYYKNNMIAAWKTLTQNTATRYKYKWWIFLLLPVVGLLMDFVWWGILLPVKWLLQLFIH